ncbi:MAG: S8 family serine peptidase [Oscillatoria sp. SIO1A7]|nr:S8 family serine peptidase [Oscillatoria sp. SIO1A7]
MRFSNSRIMTVFIAIANLKYAINRGSALFDSRRIGATSQAGRATSHSGTSPSHPGTSPNDNFGGTSAAAPFVSGVIALMLDANPNLAARDIQHIFAETAKQVDGAHEGWTTNGGGYSFNPQYGFGAVDPVAAVEAALDWTPVAEEVSVVSNLENVLSPIRDGQALTSQIRIQDDINIEHIEVQFDADHGDWGDLTIKLISPDGTESLLAKAVPDNPNDTSLPQLYSGSNEWLFSSAAHWGESSLGDWSLEVLDENGNQVEGDEWQSWKLNLYGTKPAATLAAAEAQPSASGLFQPTAAVSLSSLARADREDDDKGIPATRKDGLSSPALKGYQDANTSTQALPESPQLLMLPLENLPAEPPIPAYSEFLPGLALPSEALSGDSEELPGILPVDETGDNA